MCSNVHSLENIYILHWRGSGGGAQAEHVLPYLQNVFEVDYDIFRIGQIFEIDREF
jgi:hypothetical protein